MGACTNRSCGRRTNVIEELPEYAPFVPQIPEPSCCSKAIINAKDTKKFTVTRSFNSLIVNGDGVEIMVYQGQKINNLLIKGNNARIKSVDSKNGFINMIDKLWITGSNNVVWVLVAQDLSINGHNNIILKHKSLTTEIRGKNNHIKAFT